MFRNHNFIIPGVSASFSIGPLPPKLYWGPLFKFTFSGLYVPGAKIENTFDKSTL